MKKKKKKKRVRVKPSTILLNETPDGLWRARYDWGIAVAKDPFRAIALALRRRIKNGPPSTLHNTYRYGEWYGPIFDRRNDVEIHRYLLLNKE